MQGGAMPAERTLTTAVSYPALDKLAQNDSDSKTFSAFSG
jgi:hypothetical protein